MRRYTDISGDGGSRIVEQLVEQRQRLLKQLTSVTCLLGIGSGKGGVGKSTFTMQLALALHSQGYRVGILDADLNGPCIARMAGMQQAVLLPGEDGLIVPATRDGVKILSMGTFIPEEQALAFDTIAQGDSFVWRATKEFSTLTEILGGAYWGALDFLLVDLPPGAERTAIFVEYFGPRLKLILVTIPTDVSCSVVQRSIAALGEHGDVVLGYVENMCGYICPQCGTKGRLFGTKDEIRLGVPKLGSIAFDPRLAELCDGGMNYHAWSSLPGAGDVLAIARLVKQTLEKYHEVPVRHM